VIIKKIDEQGNLQSGNAKQSLPNNFEKLLKESFDLESNTPSDTMQLRDDSSEYFIANVKSIQPSSLKPVNSLKTNIISILEKQNKESIAKGHAMEVYNKFIENAKDSQDLKKKYPHLSIQTLTLSRPNGGTDKQLDEITSDALVNIFNLKQVNDSTSIFKTKKGEFAFAVVKKITFPQDVTSDTEVKKINAQLSDFMTSLMYQEFMQYLYSQHEIQVYQKTLENLYERDF
jgi:hypothetical protein